LVGTEDLFAGVFNYEPTKGMEPYNERFLMLKYESTSVVYNLGDVSLIQFWIFFKIFFFTVYWSLARATCCAKNKKYLKKKMK
jgi:hypothetical protein